MPTRVTFYIVYVTNSSRSPFLKPPVRASRAHTGGDATGRLSSESPSGGATGQVEYWLSTESNREQSKGLLDESLYSEITESDREQSVGLLVTSDGWGGNKQEAFQDWSIC